MMIKVSMYVNIVLPSSTINNHLGSPAEELIPEFLTVQRNLNVWML